MSFSYSVLRVTFSDDFLVGTTQSPSFQSKGQVPRSRAIVKVLRARTYDRLHSAVLMSGGLRYPLKDLLEEQNTWLGRFSWKIGSRPTVGLFQGGRRLAVPLLL